MSGWILVPSDIPDLHWSKLSPLCSCSGVWGERLRKDLCPWSTCCWQSSRDCYFHDRKQVNLIELGNLDFNVIFWSDTHGVPRVGLALTWLMSLAVKEFEGPWSRSESSLHVVLLFLVEWKKGLGWCIYLWLRLIMDCDNCQVWSWLQRDPLCHWFRYNYKTGFLLPIIKAQQ